MSVLYQALKRRDQLERGSAIPTGSVYAATPPAGQWWKGVLTLAVLLAAGAYAYTTFMPAPTPTPITATALPPAPPVENEPTPKLVDGAAPATVDIEQIAALMPDDAKTPLPTKPVSVDSIAAPQALQQRARQLQAQGATQAAIKLYAETGNDFSSQVNRWGLIAETEPQRALPRLQTLVREKPDNAAARAQLGLAYIKLNRLADAESELTAATALDPTSAQIWYNLAALSDQLSHTNAAQTAYENALLYGGSTPPFDRASVQARLSYLRGQ